MLSYEDNYGPGQVRQTGPLRQPLRAAVTHADVPGLRPDEMAAEPKVMVGTWGAWITLISSE